jgi:hypothetical protein
MKRISQYLLLPLVVFLLAGCVHAGRISGSDLTELKLGMSKQEVIGILGKPQSASANEKFETYRYWEDHGHWKHVYHDLIFVDGKLKLYGLADNPDFKAKIELIVKQR